jgi:hypothetical protein
VFNQLRHRQYTTAQSRITGIDFKDNPFDNFAGLVLGCDLLGCPHYDATIDWLTSVSISPSKFPNALSASAFGLYKASILHTAPFLHRRFSCFGRASNRQL